VLLLLSSSFEQRRQESLSYLVPVQLRVLSSILVPLFHIAPSTTISFCYHLRPVLMTALKDAREDFLTKWKNFNVAIRDIHSDFDQLYWIRTLFGAAVTYLLRLTRSIALVDFASRSAGHVIQFVPLFAISLVCFVLASYYFVLHDEVIKRWCPAPACHDHDDGSKKIDSIACESSEGQACLWSTASMSIACYLGFMIIYNYLQTTFTSPGVSSVPNKSLHESSNAGNKSWKSYHGRGGCCYINPTFNPDEERKLVELYGNDDENETLTPKSGTVFIPSPSSSYCKKCEQNRPPRCHHCSHCDRCVLQVRILNRSSLYVYV